MRSLKDQSEKLGLKKVPSFWVLQGSGILNAFATRFSGRGYVVLYSDVLASAYEEGMPAVQFIIGHELGHHKRKHVNGLKSLLIRPALFIPFLALAYSRACETTCDNIGFALCPEGADKGILILAAGRELYKKVDVQAFLSSAKSEKGFGTWLAHIFASHPHLSERVAHIQTLQAQLEPQEPRFKSSTVATKPRGRAKQTSEQPPASA